MSEGGLCRWVAEAAMLDGVTLRQPDPPGRSREVWIAAGRDGQGEPRSYVVRQETAFGPFSGTSFTLAREAGILTGLAKMDFPAPRLVAISDDGNCILIERLPGTAAFSFADEGARERTIDDFIATIVRLHRLDIDAAALDLARPVGVAEHALLDLASYRAAFADFGSDEPGMLRAFDWLEAHAPAHVTRSALLQGDTGPGNFMHLDQRVTGLIDWEAAHIGDPMDDLAWMWFRKCFLRDDADLGAWYARYVRQMGLPIDYQSICYYRVMVLARCAIATIVRRAHTGDKDDPKPARMLALLDAVLRDPLDRHRDGRGLPPVLSLQDLRAAERIPS